MKIVFWLLDINYKVKDDGTEVWLWGIDDHGKRVLIIDRNFAPYFYAVIEESSDPAKVVQEIRNKQYPFISKLEIAERKLFGKPVRTVRINCQDPEGLPKYAKALRELEGVSDCFEDDIRFSMRYLIDNNTVPCGWHEIDVAEEKTNMIVQVDSVYAARSSPIALESVEVPRLKILGFSIIRYGREGSPKADRNPVVLISAATDHGEEKQFWASEDRNDKPVLEEFVAYVRLFNPDIIVGYGSNAQDWPYLKERCAKLGLHLLVDRTDTEPHQSIYGHFSVTGRINLDLSDYVGDFPDVKVATLANLADHLGIMKTEDRTLIEEMDFAEYWDAKDKRGLLGKFSMDNAHCIIGVTDAVLDFAMQLSNLVSLPLDQVGAAAAGFRVEWFIIKTTHMLGELVPRRMEQAYRPYAGAVVLSPKPGLHENVADLDFKSMYPNLMIAYNLSPDTYVSAEKPEPPGGTYETPEVNFRFRKKPAGFYKELLLRLIKTRDEIRSRMKPSPPNSMEYRVLNARQKAVKVITNAAYGYAGWTGARWYIKPVAEAAAAWGRYTILTAIKMAEEKGLKVVYGDTDSIFVEYERDKVEELSKEIQGTLGLEIEPDKIYVRIFFTEAKKRYAGLLSDGRLDIVGLEVMRGDWADVAKNVQEKVLEIILKEQSPKKAVVYVQEFIFGLRQKRVPYRDLIIWKTLTKPAEEYEIKASHVEAAKMLRAMGWKLTVGDKVGYVVVSGSGRLYERVKPYMLASCDEVDIEYYVVKQVIPAAVRILGSFGVTEEQLLVPEKTGKDTRKLTDFFGS